MLDLTFIIPVYNTGLDLVAQCFDTVASQQTDYSYEVIVIDDGSAENYAERLREAAQEVGFRYVRIENGGVSNARNVGVREAVGEFVSFVDADDLISPYFAQDFVSAARGLDVDYVVGLIEGVSDEETDCKVAAFRPAVDSEVSLVDVPDLVGSFLLEGLDGKGPGRLRSCPVARLERRANALRAPFDAQFALGEDTLQNLSVLSDLDKVGVVRNTCYLYRANPNSVCHSFDEKRAVAVESLFCVIDKVVRRDYPSQVSLLDSLALCWLVTLVKDFYINPDYPGDAVADFNAAMGKPLWKGAVSFKAASRLPVRYRVAVILVRLRLTKLLFKLCS